jgi:transcriptional regulator with GAF, ATPase, and Fis domain
MYGDAMAERSGCSQDHHQVVGRSPALLEVLRQVHAVAHTDATVLVCGESGTGKEVIARAIHRHSRRAAAPLVRVNCAALAPTLLESELFGHERGAFTGALARRAGRFEIADGGTLFLDEIGETPMHVQPKLLRVLQEREFERLGSSQTQRCDVRLIAATNRELAAMIAERSFREDLYYRLNVFSILLPPLRERRDDIVPLAEHFVGRLAGRMNKSICGIRPESLAKLRSYDWPGNVRELHNVLERAVILASGPVLDVAVPAAARASATTTTTIVESEDLEHVQRMHIIAVLRSTNWVVGGRNGAAARLGVNRSTLNFRMKRLGIERPGTGASSRPRRDADRRALAVVE